MSRNAGKTFLQGFQPNFANTFEMGYRANLLKAEQMRQEQEKLKYQQEQQGILEQLTNGKLQGGSYRGKFAPLDMGLNPQDQTNLISRADDNTLQRYKLISEMNKGQSTQQGTVRVDNKFYKESSQFKGLPEGEAIWEQPEETTTWEYKPANEFPGLEDAPPDRKIQITKKGDKVVGQTLLPPFTQQKIDITINQPYNQLSPYAKETLEGYVEEIDKYNRYLTQTPDPKTGRIKILDKYGELEASVTPEGLKKAKQNAINGMASYLDNNGGQGVDDYRALKNQYQNNPKSLWKTIYNNYVKDLKDEKDDAWLETARYSFYIDFGYDPAGEYHLGGSTKTGKR